MLGAYVEGLHACTSAMKYFSRTNRETSEFLINAYKFGSFLKVCELNCKAVTFRDWIFVVVGVAAAANPSNVSSPRPSLYIFCLIFPTQIVA